MSDETGPLDRRLDRRVFLKRMGALTAAASAGGAVGVTPLPLAAGETGEIGEMGASAPRRAGPPRHAAAPRRGGQLASTDPFTHPVPLPDPAGIRFDDPSDLTLAEAASLIREGALDPVMLVEAYLARIEAFDAGLLAFNTVTADRAMDTARRLRDAPWRGPLHGIPLALKDNYYTAGVATTANSLIFADFVPDFDATAWARFRSAGAVLLGKTQMGPLATTAASTPDGDRTTFNAWAPGDRDVSPGGSSSGSATAVAARMAAAATGTQTGGSITNPSGAQGLTGLKPTMGRVSLYGIIPLTYTRDHPGPLCRDALDAAIALQAMAGPDPADPRTLGLPDVLDLVRAATPVRRGERPGLRWPTTIGVPPGYLDEPELLATDQEAAADQPVDPAEPDQPTPQGQPEGQAQQAEQAAQRRRRREAARERRLAEIGARRAMLDRFRDLGATVVEIEHPEAWETLTSWDFNNVRLPERAEPFLEHLRSDVRLFGVSLSPWINGLLLPGAEYLRGQRAKLALLRAVLDGIFAHCDVVLQDGPVPFDMVGLPLIAFPNGMVDGRPTGAILGGHPYAEDRLLSVVAAYQSVTGWHRERPADPAPGDAVPGRGGGGPSDGRGQAGDRAGAPRGDTRHRYDVWDVMVEGQ